MTKATLYHKILLQYYNKLLHTTKYYSVRQNITLYQNTLLRTTKYYPNTTPILLHTTKYYSHTTLYYKILLDTTKIFFVLQSTTPYYIQRTTPILFRTTKYYSNITPY